MREIADDWSFGPWLWSNSRYPHFSVKDGHSRYHGETGRLFWTIDQECDPSLITIQELRELQAHPHVYAGGHLEDCDDADCIGCDGRDRDDDEEEECDSDECLACDLADQSEFIERKVAAFIAACLRARGLGTKSAKHACSSSLVPLTPPETSGVYFVAADDRVKIGKAKNIRKRISELQTAAPHKLVLCNWIDSPDPGAEESRQHQTFKPLRVVGEWFLAKGALRRFILAENARLAPQHGSAP
ncbi:MAG: GIY-YIG nuclease family protein [Polyangiaceae bacterium]|nr:GIY-YIG nuclease family protein [Polyangiaceae bacterium]